VCGFVLYKLPDLRLNEGINLPENGLEGLLLMRMLQLPGSRFPNFFQKGEKARAKFIYNPHEQRGDLTVRVSMPLTSLLLRVRAILREVLRPPSL